MILIENGPGGGPALFDAPGRIIRAETAEEVAPALAALDAARAAGLWAAGFLSYETGYALEPRLAGLMPSRRSLPLLAFGLYGSPLAAGAVLARAGAE
ncbi:MAG: aminodeoxychorismate synthase component I, partial [Albidovulum sp.]